jgi:hypothetical protein
MASVKPSTKQETKPIYSSIRRSPTDPKLLPGQPDYLIVKPLRDDAVEVIHPRAPEQKVLATNPRQLWHIFTHPEYYFTTLSGGEVIQRFSEPPREPADLRPRYIMNDEGQIIRMARTGKTAKNREAEPLGNAAEF